MHTAIPSQVVSKPDPWNKGRLIGQKRPLKPKDVWAIRDYERFSFCWDIRSWKAPCAISALRSTTL
jgi:hypothetical protein